MKLYIALSHDEIQREIPYQLIAETASCAVWGTSRRERLFKKMFNEREQEVCESLIRMAKKWSLKTGVPEEQKMSVATYELWNRLAGFCAAI